jgi:putative oxidoreductase
LNFAAAVAQAKQSAPASLARVLVFSGLFVEVAMSLAILIGILDRLAAFVLAGYCVATAVLWKPFWRGAHFRLRGPSQSRDMFWDFLRNFALAGGFLMLTFGGDATGVAKFTTEPLSSSHPYVVEHSRR